MKLNFVEKAMMNNPVRALVQKKFEAGRLLAMGGRMGGGLALEVGCGRGIGAEIILKHFNADKIDAFDLDSRMVKLARKKLEAFGEKVNVWEGDVTKIPSADNQYDAVFDFGIIHHVPDWRRAVAEIHRVLKPNGTFYCEEVFERFITHPLWRFLLKHPQEDRFDFRVFLNHLKDSGFSIVASNQLFAQFGWFIAQKPIG